MPKEKIPKEKCISIFEENEIDKVATLSETDNIESTFEEKRESLLVLATLGMTKEYLGEDLTQQKIYKLSNNNVSKYFNRYQLVQGKRVADILREKGIRLGIKIISYFLPLTDQEKLVKDLETDELVKRELTNMIGLIVLKGGRFIALASGLIQVANHIAFEPIQLLITPPSSSDTVDSKIKVVEN